LTTARVEVAWQANTAATLVTYRARIAVITRIQIGDVLTAIRGIDAFVCCAWISIVAAFHTRDFAQSVLTRRDGAWVVIIAGRAIDLSISDTVSTIHITHGALARLEISDAVHTVGIGCARRWGLDIGWRRRNIRRNGAKVRGCVHRENDVLLSSTRIVVQIDVIRRGAAEQENTEKANYSAG